MNIPLLVSNRPTRPGLYVMLEHEFEAPRMVRVRYSHVAGEPRPDADLIVDDSRSHHHGSAPLNQQRADGGLWQWFISPNARFSEEITIT